jgi:hypothetical protein
MTDDDYRELFENMGELRVRDYARELGAGPHRTAAYRWLTIKDQETSERNASAQALQAAAASRAADAASRSADAATRAADATERQARAAESANIRATIALVIATASIIANVILAVLNSGQSSHFASVSRPALRAVAAASSRGAGEVRRP